MNRASRLLVLAALLTIPGLGAAQTLPRGIVDIYALESELADNDRHATALTALRGRLSQLAKKAGAAEDSAERRQSRRVLRAIAMGASARVQDRAYLSLLAEYAQMGR